MLLSILFPLHSLKAQNNRPRSGDERKVLDYGIGLLKRYFEHDSLWHVTHPETEKSVRGLIHFIEDQPIDSIQRSIETKMSTPEFRFVYRLPEHVADSLQVPGYISADYKNREMERITASLQKKFFENELQVPVSLVSDLEVKAGVIGPADGKRLFESRYYQLPDSLQLPDVIPDAMMQSPSDFRRFLRLDSMRTQYIEEKRRAYNDSLINAYRSNIIENYRRQLYEQERSVRYKQLSDSINVNNYHVLKQYNDDVMAMVNDSISVILGELMEYAEFIDTTTVRITNLLGEESSIFLQHDNPYFSRIWLKNEQNDSLRLLVKSTGKRSMQMLIDDGVTFSRFKPRQTKDFDFSTLQQRMSGLTGVRERYQVITPWRIGGDGNVGFTQTYLENWEKGGQSALALQIILKGYANYSRHDGKVKWENSSEIRNGYIRPGGEGAELQKNDDKFEVTSRFGVSAFKKWYYSAEFNYTTQFFNGYRYPRANFPNPISTFMSPARTFFKVGLDYKPNNNFSLLLSPLTAKNVFVLDTARIDQTKFGLARDERSAWEPGLNTDIFYRRSINSSITYETKYKMFINYLQPTGNLDVNWENTLHMKLTENINMRLLIHLIYDQKVKSPVYDANDVKIGDKTKLQLKEFFTVGFNYKINKQVTRTRKKS